LPTLPESRIAELLAPYLGEHPAPPGLYTQLSAYLDLLLRWNARTNLTAIREPELLVRRHFGESLFAAVALAPRLPVDATLLDLGSGAGLPGLPIQLLLPGLRVTLAESQGKKASFLREAVRTLALPHTEVWAGRAEDLDPLPEGRGFHAITLRAVDNMPVALALARILVRPGGLLLTFGEPYSPACVALPMPGAHTHLVLEPTP